jgi:4-hydroxybenzoyl-CoA reductase subunit beta
MGTVGGNLCLDTRCLFYNQSEWWRAANHHCLKTTGEICHVAPKSRRLLRHLQWRSRARFADA